MKYLTVGSLNTWCSICLINSELTNWASAKTSSDKRVEGKENTTPQKKKQTNKQKTTTTITTTTKTNRGLLAVTNSILHSG